VSPDVPPLLPDAALQPASVKAMPATATTPANLRFIVPPH
jgi:hypothetical protein